MSLENKENEKSYEDYMKEGLKGLGLNRSIIKSGGTSPDYPATLAQGIINETAKEFWDVSYIMEKIDRLKSFIEHENKRFNSLKSAIVTFSSPALDVCAIGEEGEYSANPDDYFTVEDDHIFEDRYLTCMCEREGWIKKIIVKENPTKGDLKNWKELAEKVELE